MAEVAAYWRRGEDAPPNVESHKIPEGMVRVALVITNSLRGIYWGFFDTVLDSYGEPALPTGSEICLRNSRHCRFYGKADEAKHLGYWSLATIGPSKDSQIGPPVSRAVIRHVANIIECTHTSVTRFSTQVWAVEGDGS
ncbi:hypothetical protein EBT31_11285 [bacterium]|nr:hypothetical protein [bacterium]